MTASADSAKAETTVSFVPALPDRVDVTLKFEIGPNEAVPVTATLLRTPGKVSDGRLVTFTAVDGDGHPIGVFTRNGLQRRSRDRDVHGKQHDVPRADHRPRIDAIRAGGDGDRRGDCGHRFATANDNLKITR